jgi:hypothetical protein
VLTIQHENQRIFLKEKRTFEPDSFLSQVARRYVCERTPYSLCSLDHTTHFLLAAWNTRRSCQKQSGAHSGKCAPTTTTHHAQAAGETACMHEDGSHSPRALSKSGSGLEAHALPRSHELRKRLGNAQQSQITERAGEEGKDREYLVDSFPKNSF